MDTNDTSTPVIILDDIAPGATMAEEPTKAAEAAEPNGKKVGIIANGQHILAWSYTDDMAIRVTGERSTAGWSLAVRCGDDVRAICSVFGGKWLAVQLAKFLRNGMVSRVQRLRKTHAKQRARKSEAATQEGGEV